MAYPTVDGPYGLVPVQRIDGMPYAGATRKYSIAAAYGTQIRKGDLVEVAAAGTIERSADGVDCIGVFMGCEYTLNGQTIHSNFYPAGTETDITAYVVDDPNVLFKVAVLSAADTMSSIGRAAIGSNLDIVNDAGAAGENNSSNGADDTEATTAAHPFRCVDVVEETATGADAFVEVLVKLNNHMMNETTGVA